MAIPLRTRAAVLGSVFLAGGTGCGWGELPYGPVGLSQRLFRGPCAGPACIEMLSVPHDLIPGGPY